MIAAVVEERLLPVRRERQIGTDENERCQQQRLLRSGLSPALAYPGSGLWRASAISA